ncbi:MAG: glycosyltransferase family 4 protein, partial [Planctomycetota bacterium]
MKTYVTVYVGAAFLTIVLTPIVSRIARATNLLDAPGVRKVHKKPIPRIGGIVFVVSLLALVIPSLFLDNIIGEAFREVQMQLIALLGTGVFIYLVGLLDDIRSLRASLKLASLLAASMVICLTGSRIETITAGKWFTIELGWFAWPLTLGWITAVTVGINFIDGLDGLAAGIAAIVCGTIAVFAYHSGQIAMFVLLLGLLGSLTGFLLFNFNPAKIFMGDGGSMFIGFMIGAGSVVCQAKSATLVGIALPALALGVPILDTALTMIRRTVLDKRSIFAGERGHIHHRLLDRGLDHRTVVFVIYGMTLVAAGLGLLMLSMREGAQIAMLGGGMLFLFVAFALAGSTRVKETFTTIRNDITAAREKKEEKG